MVFTRVFKDKKKLDWGLCLLLFITAVVVRFIYQFHQFDDAFISFRYSLNLLHGKGLVYNEGLRVLGTTTPLFTVLLSGLAFVFRTENFPLLANTVNHLADGGSAILLYFIGLRLWRSRSLACLLSLFFVLSFHSVFYSGTGMETEFYSFIVLFALERALRNRFRAALVLAVLALMTRPDALLLVAALAVYIPLAARKRFRPAAALPALALLLPYMGFLYFYYGSVIPQSMVAKSVMWGTWEHKFSLDLPNHYEVMMFWSGFLSKSHTKQYLPNVVRLIPMAALFLLGMGELARRSRRMLLLPIFCLLFTLAYAKSSVYIFPWYLVPTVPYLELAVFAAIKMLGERMMRMIRVPPLQGAAVICALVLVMQSFVFVGVKQGLPSAIQRVMYPAHTEKLYREALTHLHPAKPHFSIMAPEIGYIGFYCPESKMIDPVGLTNPEVTDFYRHHTQLLPKELRFVNRAMVDEFKPDYIIVLSAFIEPTLDKDPVFKQHYELVPVPLDDSFINREPVFLYQRRAS